MSDREYKRYAEYKAGGSHKFYEVEVLRREGEKSATFTARWGRIGTRGQSKVYGLVFGRVTLPLGSVTTVVTSYAFPFAYLVGLADGKFTSKLQKGYREVSALEALASALTDPRDS